MKTIFSLLLFTVFFSRLNSQVQINNNLLSEYENIVTNEGYELSEEINYFYPTIDGGGIYLESYRKVLSVYPYLTLNFFDDVLKGNLSSIVRVDNDLEEIGRFDCRTFDTSFSKVYSILSIDYSTLQDSGFFRAFGISYPPNLAKEPDWFFAKFDTTLSLTDIFEFESPTDSDSYPLGGVFEKLADNSYIIKAIRQGAFPQFYEIQFYRINLQGELLIAKDFGLDWEETPYQLEGVKVIDDDHIVALKNKILDKNFDEVCDFENQIYNTIGRLFKMDSTRFLFGGADARIGGYQNAEIVCIADRDCNLDTIFYRRQSGNNAPYGSDADYASFSAIDTSNIYLGSSAFGSYLTDSLNKIILTSINTRGEVNWSYILGGDASYSVAQVSTLTDGSFLGFVYRAVSANTEWGYTTDLYRIRIDKNGNIQTLNSTNQLDGIPFSVNIFPNPVSSQLVIQKSSNFKSAKMYLYDSYGRLVNFQELLNDRTELDVSNFKEGFYFYQIWSNNQKIDVGKIVVLN